MKRSLICRCLVAVLLVGAFPIAVRGQSDGQPKPLADRILTVIPPKLVPTDTFTPLLPIPGLKINRYTPHYTPSSETLFGQASQVVFYRNVWGLEFATTGLRQIELMFRRPDGSEVNKHFYYMVYRVRNFGNSLSYDIVKEQLEKEFIKYELQRDKIEDGRPAVGPDKFRPLFSLEGWVHAPGGEMQQVAYLDSYLPEVAKAIQRREDPNLKLHDQLEIQSVEIPLSVNEDDPGVWGIAVWENVHPRLNFISVYVSGLTNAYRIDIDSEANQTLRRKVLKLNFWRSGDSYLPSKDNVIYGIPFTDVPTEQIEICRRYQLPGPQFHVTMTNPTIDGEFTLVDVNAAVDMETLDCPELVTLADGKLPESIVEALTNLNFEVDESAAVTTRVPGKKWTFDIAFNGGQRTLNIHFVPQYWEKEGKGVRFLRSLDYFWVYR